MPYTINRYTYHDIHPWKVFELSPMCSQKSFYGKAKIVEVENGYYLQSYNTIVCYIDKPGIGKPAQFTKLWDSYSATTMRHINSFMQFIGFNVGGKKWWDSLETNHWYTISEILNMV